jgi:ornithine cyclodeaminase
MTQVITWQEIERRLAGVNVLGAMEEAFDAYSQGLATIPPVGELTFTEPPGDVHIKYGAFNDGSHYVVKVASGFYGNPGLGLSSCQGLMLLFDQKTGFPSAILLDEGRLTDIRTGAAGAVAAKVLAPKTVEAIGMLGTGIQARRQLESLVHVTPCRRLVAWGRNESHLKDYMRDARAMGFEVVAAKEPEEVAAKANLLVTTTPSTVPLLRAEWIRPGTHITAVGADTGEKQELDSRILKDARVVSDSIPQSRARGEVFRARQEGLLNEAELVELGDVVGGRVEGRRTSDEVTVADLTGVAVQDLAIAVAVFNGT